mmetsp:Transcript_25200/g.60608  ORF Transcript_25200/g.60608 Transcript_25200/m.60608 type:complete len:393 (+) Transcript_25200:480-1658(+)
MVRGTRPPLEASHDPIRRFEVLAGELRDSLAQHHQLVRVGAVAHGVPDHHFDEGVEKRFLEVHGAGRRVDGGGGVRLETDPRRRLSLPRISRPLLRLRRHRRPAHPRHLRPPRPRPHRPHLHHPPRIHPRRPRGHLLPNLLRGQLRLLPPVLSNGREGVGALRPLHGSALPRAHGRRLHVGEHHRAHARIHERPPLLDHLHHRGAVRAHRVSPHGAGRDRREELREPRFQCAHPHDQGGARDSHGGALVPQPLLPDDRVGILALLGHLHRAPLHLRVHVGTPDLHPLWHPPLRLRPPHHRHVLHQRGVAVLPAGEGRPSMVVEHLHQRGNDRIVHLRILLLLLLPSKRHERSASILVLLWVHVDHLVRILLDVGQCRVPLQPPLCEAHLFTG